MIKNNSLKFLILGVFLTFTFVFFQWQEQATKAQAMSKENNVESAMKLVIADKLSQEKKHQGQIQQEKVIAVKVVNVNQLSAEDDILLSAVEGSLKIQDVSAKDAESSMIKHARLHGHEKPNHYPYTNERRPPGEPKKPLPEEKGR